MTLVRANARLPGLDTGDTADVDLDLPLWANRVGNGLVSIADDPPPPPAPPLPPPPAEGEAEDPLVDLVRTLNVQDTVDLVIIDNYPVERVLAAERAAGGRKTVLSALERLAEPVPPEADDQEAAEGG